MEQMPCASTSSTPQWCVRACCPLAPAGRQGGWQQPAEQGPAPLDHRTTRECLTWPGTIPQTFPASLPHLRPAFFRCPVSFCLYFPPWPACLRACPPAGACRAAQVPRGGRVPGGERRLPALVQRVQVGNAFRRKGGGLSGCGLWQLSGWDCPLTAAFTELIFPTPALAACPPSPIPAAGSWCRTCCAGRRRRGLPLTPRRSMWLGPQTCSTAGSARPRAH